MHLECMANYLAELSLLEYGMHCYAPSLIAASATFLAKYMLSPLKNPWVCVVWEVSKLFYLFFWSILFDSLTGYSCCVMLQNSTLICYTFYQPSNLRGCVKALHRLILCRSGGNSNLPAIREKYSHHKVRKITLYLK